MALWLALDGDLFWDEPGYLYVAVYVQQPTFLAGTYQVSVIDYFYLPKILHLILVKGVLLVTDPGLAALAVIAALYVVMLGLTLLLVWAIIARLLPRTSSSGLAVLLVALTPLVLYMAFKTLPGSPALLFAVLALYALIRSLEGASLEPRTIGWKALAVVALVGMALTRDVFGLLLASFVIAATIATLLALGIAIDHYLAAHALFEKVEPLIFRFFSTAPELGALWLVVPLALLQRARRELWFFMLWLAVATLPMLFFQHLESRYLAPNLAPFAGLAALLIDELKQRFGRLHASRSTTVATAAALAVLLATNWIALRLMPAEVNVWQMDRLLASVDRSLADRDYAILTPWTTSDFYYLRFAYPGVPRFQCFRRAGQHHAPDAAARGDGGRILHEPPRVLPRRARRLPEALVCVGYHETFMLANAKAGLVLIPGLDVDRLLPDRDFIDHLATSWVWRDPDARLTPLAKAGHYYAFILSFDDVTTEEPAEAESEPVG